MTEDMATERAAGLTTDRLARAMLVVGLVALAATIVVAIVVALHRTNVFPNDDQALIDLRVRDVGAYNPLVGSYERFGGNQPGPFLFYLLAAPYRIVGAGPSGLAVATVLITFASIGGCVLIAARRGGPLGALWAVGLFLLVLEARGVDVLFSPWEPQVLLTALALLMFLVWDLASGRVWALPVAAVVATLLAQAWVVFGVFVAVLGGVGAVIGIANLVRERRAPGSRHGALAAIGTTVVVVGILWLPPVVEQLTHDPGNLTELSSIHRTGRATGLVDGYRTVAIQFGSDAPWLGHTVPTAAFSPTVDLGDGDGVPLALLAFAGAAILAGRRRARVADRLNLVVGATLLAAIVTCALVFGGVFVWIVEPDRVVAMMLWLAAGWSVVAALPAGSRRTFTRVAAPVLAAGVVAISILLVTDLLDQPDDAGRLAEAVGRLADDALADRRTLAEPVLVESTAHAAMRGEERCCAPILASALERGGADVVVSTDEAHRFAAHRAHPGAARSQLLLTTFTSATPPARRGYVLVATTDPLTRRERARLTAIDLRLRALVGRDPGVAAIAAAERRSPEVARLFRARGRLPDFARLALYRRPAPTPVT